MRPQNTLPLFPPPALCSFAAFPDAPICIYIYIYIYIERERERERNFNVNQELDFLIINHITMLQLNEFAMIAGSLS